MSIKRIKEVMTMKASCPNDMDELRTMLQIMWSYGLMKGSTYESLLEYADDLEIEAGTAVRYTVHCTSSRRV